MKIKWYGTASVSVSSGETTLLFDPYLPMRGSKSPIKRSDFDGFDTIVCTHSHFDHIASIPALFRKAPREIYGTQSVMQSLTTFGLPAEKLHEISPGESLCFGDIKLTVFKAKHVQYDDAYSHRVLVNPRVLAYIDNLARIMIPAIICKERLQTVGYLIEAEGKSAFLLGSLGWLPEVSYPTGVDLLILPYQGTSDLLTPALEFTALIQPKAIWLDHFDNAFPPLTYPIDTSDIEQALEGVIPVIRPEYGSEIEL